MTSSALIPPEEFLAADWAREHDNPAITVESVVAKLSEDQRSKLLDARRKLQGLSSTAELFKHGKDYSQERIELHRKIIEHFLNPEHVSAATPNAGEAPVLVMLADAVARVSHGSRMRSIAAGAVSCWMQMKLRRCFRRTRAGMLQ